VATIAATATTVPAHRFTLADAKRALQQATSLPAGRLQAIESIFDNAGVEQRFAPFPVDYLVRSRPLEQVSAEYRAAAIELGCRVVQECLARADVGARDVGLLITVSCTGIMIPSLDAYLVNALGFDLGVRRLPITELGCSGAAVALSRAREFLMAYPDSNALVVAVEFPSLTFQPADTSIANLISCALFGDGGAAALVSGRDRPGVRIIDSEARLFPNSYDALGFELRQTGLHIVLGKHLTDVIRSHLRTTADQFLERNGASLDRMSFVALHPGGRKLIDAAEAELGASRCLTQPTWDVLREYGNLSSASVLFVLNQWMSSGRLKPGDQGLMVAFGPGFSVELLLLQCA
jgi:alkylresorcinol/alkylpyrone synthase